MKVFAFKSIAILIILSALLLFDSCSFNIVSISRRFKHHYFRIDDSLLISRIKKPNKELRSFKKDYVKRKEKRFDLLGLYLLSDTIAMSDTISILNLCNKILKEQYPNLPYNYLAQNWRSEEAVRYYLFGTNRYSFFLRRGSLILIFEQQIRSYPREKF